VLATKTFTTVRYFNHLFIVDKTRVLYNYVNISTYFEKKSKAQIRNSQRNKERNAEITKKIEKVLQDKKERKQRTRPKCIKQDTHQKGAGSCSDLVFGSTQYCVLLNP
jgi:hypothetical protein